jgi:hypothetical protein
MDDFRQRAYRTVIDVTWGGGGEQKEQMPCPVFFLPKNSLLTTELKKGK